MSFSVANPVQDFKMNRPIVLGYVSSSLKWITLPPVFQDLRAACIERNFATEDPTVASIYYRGIQWEKIDRIGCLMGVAAIAAFCFLRCCFYQFYRFSWRSFNPYYDVINLAMTGLFLKAMHWIFSPSSYQLIQPVTWTNSSLLTIGLKDLANNTTTQGKFEDAITGDEFTPEEIIRPVNIAFGRYAVNLVQGLESMLRQNWGQGIPHPCESRLFTPDEQSHVVESLCAFFSIQEQQHFVDCWKIDTTREISEQIPFYNQLSPEEKSQITIDKKSLAIRQNRKFLALLPPAIVTKHFGKLETTDLSSIQIQVAKDLRESGRYQQLERQFRRST
ncbi:MAG TPA: hypothetical protein PKW79_02630 [Rhabdochlamydiaceae bacterium]|nr:hypothetical protein [Rhabdochlamydiaceae bacterium]